ncbi:MAG: Uncharacterized protein FD152_3216 [Xanthobacteraceae bacterium]|nr:MAG: Uncharacterized protein FD152_3216 [Xanthobacteraceae bacterium]
MYATSPSYGRRVLACLVTVLCLLVLASPDVVQAQDLNARAAQKCDRYRQGWEDALRRRGTEGLSPGGCLGPADICPRDGAETDLANVMTVRAMNAGMASTFLPWACR